MNVFLNITRMIKLVINNVKINAVKLIFMMDISIYAFNMFTILSFVRID